VLWKETAFPLCRAMERRWKRNVVSRVFSVTVVIRLPKNQSLIIFDPRYNCHSAGSMGWPFPMLKYKYISQIKYKETILSNSTREVLWFEITKILIAF